MSIEMIGNIFKTKDYDMFKWVKGNRKPNKKNYSKLVKSMKEEQLIIPICVNEKFEIIDGQHRFSACKDLELPVYYYVVSNYGIEQVKRANIVSSNWRKEDYLHMFLEENNEVYREFNSILESYDITISSLLKVFAIIQNKNAAAISYDLENGNLTLDGKSFVIEFLMALEDFNFFKYYKTTQFLSAFIKLYFKDEYEHEKMKSKLIAHRHMLVKKNSMDEYLSTLCNKIYSYGVTKNPIYYSSESKKFHQ